MKLYCFGESGNAYKAALALELSNLKWEPIFVDFFNGEARSETYKKINPMGEVPTLVTNDGITITQSGAIQQYITDKTGKFSIANVPDGTYEIVAWQEKFGSKRTLSQNVTVKSGKAVVNFEFSRPKKK